MYKNTLALLQYVENFLLICASVFQKYKQLQTTDIGGFYFILFYFSQKVGRVPSLEQCGRRRPHVSTSYTVLVLDGRYNREIRLIEGHDKRRLIAKSNAIPALVLRGRVNLPRISHWLICRHSSLCRIRTWCRPEIPARYAASPASCYWLVS